MRLLAIDPGTTKSALVILDTETKQVVHHDILENGHFIARPLMRYDIDHMACEMIACYGMAAGKSLFDTALWIGRFVQEWTNHHGDGTHNLVLRKGRWGPGPSDTGPDCLYNGVCMHLCKSTRAKDANIRQALIDRWGGSKKLAIGKKGEGRPLYGIKADEWQALGVAVTFAEQVWGLKL